MNRKIAIDPGKNGGIAWKDEAGVFAEKMPETPMDVLQFLRKLAPGTCCIEAVGSYVSGNSGPSAAKFARHCGHLDVALLAAEIPAIQVQPKKWQYWLIGRPNYPAIPKETPAKEKKRVLAQRKAERKRKIKAKVQALYPHLKITLATADALGMLAYLDMGVG